MKTGIVDVGGGMRDIYGAGIFDYCLEAGVDFDLCIGISAGSANMASFLAGQKRRNYEFYMNYAFRKEYISFRNWIRSRNFVNLEYSYGTLSNSGGEYPLDYPALRDNPVDYLVVTTSALTGEPVYFDKSGLKQDDYGPIKASSNMPIANQPYMIDGTPYFDGGISDPVPVEACLKAGCSKVILILTRPKDYRRSADRDRFASRFLKKRYPNAARALQNRAGRYNTQLDYAEELEKQGKVLILAPDSIGRMKTLSKDREAMEILYQKGYEDAKKIPGFLWGKQDVSTAK